MRIGFRNIFLELVNQEMRGHKFSRGDLWIAKKDKVGYQMPQELLHTLQYRDKRKVNLHGLHEKRGLRVTSSA
jgi:hypothetical protein